MDESAYDEFGNYVGGDLSDDDDSEDELLAEQPPAGFSGRGDPLLGGEGDEDVRVNPVVPDLPPEKRAVVLHEDKKYYPEAEEIYGPDAVVLVQEEDTMPITEPIIPPARVFDFDLVEREVPTTSFKFDYLAGLMQEPDLIRNVAFVGHLQSGKTSLIDCMVRQTHEFKSTKLRDQFRREMRYLDSRKDEAERGVSVKASPISLVLPDKEDKSFLLNAFDTPGHPNFQDEVVAATRICDGAVFVVDVIMGTTAHDEKLLKHLVQEGLDIVLCVNKIDRLVTELKLPPADAYHKIKHTIDEVNGALENIYTLLEVGGSSSSAAVDGAGAGAGGEGGKNAVKKTARKVLSPTKGNVFFAAGLFNVVFSLRSFAQIYADTYAQFHFDQREFAPLLWGDIYFNEETRKFSRTPPEDYEDPVRTFVAFILEPLYKLIGHTLGEEKEDVKAVYEQCGIYLPNKHFQLSTKNMLKSVGSSFFGGNSALVDCVVKHVRNPREAAADKCARCYTGDQTGKVAEDIRNLNSKGLLMIHTVKCYHHPDLSTFDVLGRVMSGTLHAGDRVQVFGENYSLSDDEDRQERQAQTLWISQGRYRVEISHVPAGNWVLLSGVESNIVKTATITSVDNTEEVEIFRPLSHTTTACCKIALEPLNPSELPKMVSALRKIDKSYPICHTKVEESGEHVISGTGELYLDCVLHDLRRLYGDLEIKVSDPIVSFQETVSETSSMKCQADSMNKLNKLYMTCDPLEMGIQEDIEKGRIPHTWELGGKEIKDYFKNEHKWDLLAAKGIWAFGPTERGCNMLLNDTLDVNQKLLATTKESIVQGFQWAAREGPLCDEAIRGVKWKLLDARLDDNPQSRGGGQVIPCARRCAYAAFLMAAPRMLEPVFFAEITCPADAVQGVYTVLSRRRGHVARDYPKPGSPLYVVEAFLPTIESFGFETDIRSYSSGSAMVVSWFDHWSQVPGDPLDRSILLRPLEPAPIPHLAREFMLKTRRRKGLAEEVNISKYLDQENYLQFAREEQMLHGTGAPMEF